MISFLLALRIFILISCHLFVLLLKIISFFEIEVDRLFCDIRYLHDSWNLKEGPLWDIIVGKL